MGATRGVCNNYLDCSVSLKDLAYNQIALNVMNVLLIYVLTNFSWSDNLSQIRLRGQLGNLRSNNGVGHIRSDASMVWKG